MSKLFFVVFLCLIISVFAISPADIGCTDISQAEFDEKITIASSVGRTALEKKWSTDAGTNVLLTTSTSLVWIY
uniref:U30-Theriditoxin-Lha1a_1 n=1 Tax=Latrodectus hasselti TaxID=256736 RepID=A0A482Z729_LATHA